MGPTLLNIHLEDLDVDVLWLPESRIGAEVGCEQRTDGSEFLKRREIFFKQLNYYQHEAFVFLRW
jgi:hypothetical protein